MSTKHMKNTLLICLGLIIIPSLISCTTTHSLGQFSQKLISEQIIKTAPNQSIEITQKPNPQMPVIKFIVVTPTSEYILRKYEKLEKIEETTDYQLLTIGGGIAGGLGLLYFLANPVPDPAEYSESKFDSLDKDALSKRKTGMSIMLLGLAAGICGFSNSPPTINIIEKPVGVFEEKISKNQQKIQFTVGMTDTVITDTTNDKGEGAVKVDELLTHYLLQQVDLPESITIGIKLEGDERPQTELILNIEETIAIMSHGKIDWKEGKPPKGLVPYLEAKAEITGTAKAGSTVILKIQISNKEGKSDCYRLQSITKSEEPLFSNRRIMIGYLKAGENVLVEDKIEISNDYRFTKEGQVSITIKIQELNNNIPKSIDLIINTEK